MRIRTLAPLRFVRWSALVASGLVLSQAACSLVLSTKEEQCETDADCKARGSAFSKTTCSTDKTCVTGGKSSSSSSGGSDPRFACASEPLEDTDRDVAMRINFVDSSQSAVKKGLAVRLCGSTDAQCASPRALDGDETTPDGGGGGFVAGGDTGAVTGKVAYGFEGYFEVLSNDFAPNYRYSSPPLRSDTTVFDQVLLKPAEIAFYANAVTGKGAESYESQHHALVFVLAQDCQRAPLSGVRFTANVEDDQMVPFYVYNSLPDSTATSTEASGRAGFLNVPEGLVTFTAELEESGERIGSTSILVRAGAVTTVAVLPSP